MPNTPFDTAHQESFRATIGRALPRADVQHAAEAAAAGYDYHMSLIALLLTLRG